MNKKVACDNYQIDFIEILINNKQMYIIQRLEPKQKLFKRNIVKLEVTRIRPKYVMKFEKEINNR